MIKYTGMYLQKTCTGSVCENYKILKEDTLKDVNEWGDIPCSGIESFDTVNTSVLFK